ncbi:hypothetical protein [Spirosoma rigui]|uniref:hypothetical protein n=1 Tax=Spirosoma rigui TaxID=564064 RepID=UPI0012D2EF48|nr:hypothetical protein [Spirosoma rigui]
MLILEILIGVLLLGICSFMAGQFVGPRTSSARSTPPDVSDPKRQRALIENKLDHLLLLHQQGQLPEKQYLFLVDQLIDQLVTLRNATTKPVSVSDELIR